jgi:HTH-type transcriptional regulator, competence development regulator
MSRLNMATQQPFGATIRHLRQQRGEPLRAVAASLNIDSTLLSKIERGQRLPTNEQVAGLAAYFDVSLEELTAKVIAEKILSDYGYQAATLKALTIVRERLGEYLEEPE